MSRIYLLSAKVAVFAARRHAASAVVDSPNPAPGAPPVQRLAVAIQGIRASFHDVAARKYFSEREVDIVECPSFRALCTTLADRKADVAVMAIENTIAGSILSNYALLEAHAFRVFGEVYLRIEHCLLGLPGQRLAEVRVIQSHPMALLQCEEFLARFPEVQVLEGSDTAMSARLVKEGGKPGHAAIASRLAAETFGLQVLEEGIETNKKNFTRFLVLCRAQDHERHARPDLADKASIRFETPHSPGSLVDVLEVFRSHGINMTKIQSLPILGRPYQYGFHVDLEWDDSGRYTQFLRALMSKVTHLSHFGDYPRGEW
jgi:prephenate dehydratase